MYVMFTLMIFVGAIVLQTSVLDLVAIKGIKPDLVLLMVVYLGLVKGSDIGCTSGFFFGLVEDIFSGVYFGSNALTKTIIGFFCGASGKRLYTQSMLSQMLCVGIGTVVNVILLLSINGFGAQWTHQLLYESLYNMLCCPLIVWIFRWGEKRFGKTPSSKF